MKLFIKNGHVLDPSTGTDEVIDILIDEGIIVKTGKELKCEAERVVDAKDCYVMPGFIDLHVHLRDPGFEHKETVESGVCAAARGGYTTILAMPNTKPVVDNADVVNYVHRKAENVGKTRVLQIGAVTKGQKGESLSDIRGMAAAGTPAISEDGKSVMNTKLYKEAMEIAAECEIPVFAHCEDQYLVDGGVVNADTVTEKMGFPGITNNVEDVIIARDIMLAKETGAKLHLCHCSTKDSVKMVKQAKEEGISVTAEVCPHHFILTTDDLNPRDTNYKMNPPLRTKEDVETLRQGLKENIMDVIATDHAPHTVQDKNCSMEKAPFGIVGIETAAALTYTELVLKGYLTPMQMAEKMSYNPAKVIGSDRGSLREGKPADIVIFDPEKEYQIDAEQFVSKGRNTPFHGRSVTGEVRMTVCDGRVIYEAE
ncbi:MAG: dihydroorotase [Lachnospiraceae bacterium]|nr:dihydroorotase [Lachnospiraceae bacterium]